LSLEGEDLRDRPLRARAETLSTSGDARIDARLLYVDHLEERGLEVFNAVSEGDCEGLVPNGRRAATTLIASRPRG